MNEQIIQWL